MRRKARAVTLQALYESDCVGHDLDSIIQRLSEEESLPEDAVSFVQELTSGVVENMTEIDKLISRFAPNFPVSQLALTDRAILRIAIFEIIFAKKVSVKIAINEAVELAKTFGSDNSHRFINGVLASVNSMMLQK